MTEPETRPNASADVTPERDATTAERAARRKRAIVGVVVAMVGVAAAVFPDSAALRALHRGVPQVADLIPTVVITFGVLLAAFSLWPGLVAGRAEVSTMVPLVPSTPQLLIAAAASLVGAQEQGGKNRGPMIELFCRGVKQSPGEPGCAPRDSRVTSSCLLE